MVTQLDSTALREVALFRELSSPELATLAGQFVRRRYGRNELIFCQGDPGDGLYIIATGNVGIGRQGTTGNELILTVLEPGDYFGELALFDGQPRSATATAVTDASLLFLPRTAF